MKDSEQKYRDIVRAYNDAVQDSGAEQTYKSALQAYTDALQNRPPGGPPMPLLPLPPTQEGEGEEWKGGDLP